MSRGQGRLYRPKVDGKECRTWWLDYSVNGQRHREAAGTTSKAEAQRVLREKIVARESGKVTGRPDRVTFADLRTMLERQYALDGRRSIDRLRQGLHHLEEFFGEGARVPTITASRLDAFAASRLAAGAARATVNYELAAIRRAFHLAIAKGILASMPAIRLTRLNNARSGFFEEGDFAAVVVELPAHIQPLVRFLRLTGWRRSEALSLTWDQVDLEGRAIRLAAIDTKGREARLFPYGMAPELVQLVEAQHAARDGLFVFHRGGLRIGIMSLRDAWMRACKRAGLDGRLVHDLRRSAARDLRRAGVSEGEIMKLCGWKTRSMFDRYNIIDEDDLARAVAKRFNGKGTTQSGAAGKEVDAVS